VKLDKLSKSLEKERHLSQLLLDQILPEKVVNDLREGRNVKTESYSDVTVFFSDIVGFTKIASDLSPEDVIDMLNQLYSVMDHLCTKFGLYKVETIGDAYMAVSGLPVPDENHALNIANFSIAVLSATKNIKIDGKSVVLRIGIHTGPVMTGMYIYIINSYLI
jgi:class 3 adenylate cyclase